MAVKNMREKFPDILKGKDKYLAFKLMSRFKSSKMSDLMIPYELLTPDNINQIDVMYHIKSIKNAVFKFFDRNSTGVIKQALCDYNDLENDTIVVRIESPKRRAENIKIDKLSEFIR